MDGAGYWVPYQNDESRCSLIVVGPFETLHHADIAFSSMRRAATLAEYVGDVLFAVSEHEALERAVIVRRDETASSKRYATRQLWNTKLLGRLPARSKRAQLRS